MRKIASLCAVLMLFSALAFAQTRSVTGQIKDDRGVPIPFATILETGTRNATKADDKGFFSINIKDGSKITITAAGHQQKTITPEDGSQNIELAINAGELTEVIVTSLGVGKTREKIGYATTTFKSEDINRTAPVSALDGLQGKIAGADISTVGGQPGASSKVILRGYSSLQGSNQALIVIDGVPLNNSRLGSGGGLDFGNGLNDINPNDIDNITILKGAAATSLYGSRAQNGVVVITTKKGRSGKLKIDFSSSYIYSTVAKLPEFQNTFGQGWNGLHYKEENGSWGPKLDGVERLWGSTVDNSRLIKPFSAVKDNVKDFYDPGMELNNSISLRGGNENANFFFSYGNVHSDGILPSDADSYNRHTISLRSQLKAADKFTISSSFNYINKYGGNVTTNDDEAGSGTFENIIQIARDIHIVDFKDYNNKFFNVDNYFTPYAANPYFSLYENGNRLNNDRFFGNLELAYTINKWLNVKWRTGGDFTNARLKDWQAIERPKPGSWRGPLPTNFEGASYTAKVGGVTERSDYIGEINSDIFLNFDRDIANDFNLSGFIGGNFNQRQGRAQVSRITDLLIPNFYNLSNTTGIPNTSEAISKRRLFGAYAQANLAFKDYLYLSLNARNDWSSTLPEGKRSFFYPGANLSFVLSKLLDIKPAKVDYLKIRVAYGQTGKDADPYLLESVLARGNVGLGFGNILFPIGGVSAFELANTIGNKALEPEITTEFEVGLEAKFLKSRIGIDVSYYNKVSDGQILNIPIAPSTGFTAQVANFGKLENQGVEATLNIVPVKTRDFTWDINYTFTKNTNKIKELPSGLDKVDFTSYFAVKMVGRVGEPMGIIEAPRPTLTDDGKYVVNGSNGFFIPTGEDHSYGNVQRDFIMGLNNSFTYKNWRLGFTLDYRKGGYFVSRTADLTYFVGNAYLSQYNNRRPFIIPNSVVQDGVDAQGKPLYIENTHPIDIANFNSYWYHTSNDAFAWGNMILPRDFLKLRDVSLSYTLPKTWSGKIRADYITLTAIGRNILLWTPERNIFIDPEISDLGNDFLSEFGEQAAAPSTRSYGVSLKVGF
jgi:TonB-linked SusC/RagA family outer membrane protein